MIKRNQQRDISGVSLAKFRPDKYLTLRHLRVLLTAIAISLTSLTYAQPVANFSGNPIAGCAPLVVQFTDQSTGSPTQWQWNLGNATTSTLQNPATTYFTPGTYTVSLTASNAQGSNSITKVQYITVYDTPNVNINANIRIGCKPLTVDFSDLSVANGGTIASWHWDFGDGNTSTLQNPSHTYISGGTFAISLKVVTSNGCSKTRLFPAYITVGNGVVANFLNSTPTTCVPPIAVSFQNLSIGQGQLAYLWNFGDGGTSTLANPVHNYASAGNYDVSLIVNSSDGCSDTIIRAGAVNIGNVMAAFSGPATVCQGATVSFTNNSFPATAAYLWDFGNGNTSTQYSPTTVYNTPGTYNVVLTSTLGNCTAADSMQVHVLPKPTGNFLANDSVSCNTPFVVNFQSTSTATSYLWNFGDGGTSTDPNPSHTYTGYGSYTVTLTLTGANGCQATITKPDYIKVQQLLATISGLPLLGCNSFTHTFSVTNNLNLPIANYQWSLGSAGTSSLPNPSATFGPGVHNISVSITTVNGCTATASSTISIGNTLHANFSATPRVACAATQISFTDLSTGNPTQWQWNFGDGGSSTLQNPTYQYNDTGHFTVTLIISNYGCRDTVRFVNYITILPPLARINYIFDCSNPYTYNFIDASIGADTWHWDFGDGDTSILQNPPAHTYAAPGVYMVKLTVWNNVTGCTHSNTFTATVVDEHPDFSNSSTQTCRLSPITFSVTNAIIANLSNVYWDFGDNNTGGGPTVQHAYTTPGTYTVKMIATDINGCKDTVVKANLLTVYGPTANFSPSTTGTCSNLEVEFTDLSIPDGIHPIVAWGWNYGDGNSQNYTTPPFVHTYASSGSYYIKLIVTDNIGCIDSITLSQPLQIAEVIANFVPSDTLLCPNGTINFSNLSTGPQLQYHWDFDDGTFTVLPNPSHTFTSNGVYDVSLIATGQFGCKDTLVKTLNIVTPVSAFQMSDSVSVCPPFVVHFTSLASGFSSLRWEFGDGATSVLQNPDHTYTMPGQYIVKLTAIGYGAICSTIFQDTINVSGPQGTFGYTPIVGCSPLTVAFNVSSQNTTSVVWDFMDGSVETNSNLLNTHVYAAPGNFLPRAILKDANGCAVPINGSDTIKVFDVETNFTTTPILLCDSGYVQFSSTQVTNDIITNHQWDFGDASPSVNQQNPLHFYQSPGLYNAQLITTTQHGCKDTAAYPIPIRVVRSPSLIPIPPLSGCMPFSTQFFGALAIADTSIINWVWDFGNGTTSTMQSPATVHYPSPGVYNILLTAVNSSGCKDTLNTTVTVHALPNIIANYDTTICQGQQFTLQAMGGATYLWFGAALSCTNCPSPIITPLHTSNYYLTGTDMYGCVNKDSIRVKVVEPFVLSRSPNDTLCVGERITLTASGTDNYSWVENPGGATHTGPTITLIPQHTTIFNLTATDYKGCFTVKDSIKVKVYPIPVVNAGNDTTINVGQAVVLSPSLSADISSITWSPTSTIVAQNYPKVTVKPKQTTNYTIIARNDGGCRSTDNVTVFIICNGDNFFVPNTFTPNNDGMNDKFYPRGSGLFRIKSMRIFDRWGEMVYAKTDFTVNDPNAGWDGTYKGQRLNMDVYIYMIEIICDNGQILLHKGNVALVK